MDLRKYFYGYSAAYEQRWVDFDCHFDTNGTYSEKKSGAAFFPE